MKLFIVLILFYSSLEFIVAMKNTVVPEEELLDCKGKRFVNVSLTAYYPDYSSPKWRRAYLDSRGKKLRTLQDFLDDRVDYVTLAMDEKLKIPYGTAACSPELNQHYRRRIRLQVRDDGEELFRLGYSRADICVRTEADSYDDAVNRQITLIF